MGKIQLVCLMMISILLASCAEERFSEIHPQWSFITTMNILEPSLQFFNEDGELLAEWLFEKAYTGAVLVGDDKVIVYGHQLEKAIMYELSSGAVLKEIEVGIGTTNAYHDDMSGKLFLTNSKTNELYRYSADGAFEQSVKLRNYPMAMTAVNNKLYVINYKDTVLSVVDIMSLHVTEEWTIAKSSNGMIFIPEKNELWLGGHGEGRASNRNVITYTMDGQQKQSIYAPLMPIGFSKQEEEVAIVSHGTNMLYVTNVEGKEKWSLEIAANPFAVAHFNDALIVVGYDDQSLYYTKDGEIVRTVTTRKGPFQLLVREAS